MIQQRLQSKKLNHAILHLAEQMQFVPNVMEPELVLAYLTTLEILTLVAGQSVFKIPIVIDRRHVLTTSVKTHVQVFVVSTLNVECKIIHLSAFV